MLQPRSPFLIAVITSLALAGGCTFEGEVEGEFIDEEEPPTGDEVGIAEARNPVQTAIDFGLGLIGTRYGWWYSGPLPKGAPMWTAAGPPPSSAYVRARSTNCTGLTNLMLRKVGKPLPWAAGAGTGGTYAYSRYYANVAKPFNPNVRYPAGTLVGRRYRDTYDQGHVGVVLADGRLLQSFAWTRGGGQPGVNKTYTVAQSHDGGFYEYAVLPQDWLGSAGGTCDLGDGTYCGGNGVSGSTSSLYQCKSGVATRIKVCSAGCQRMPDGTADRCKPTSSGTTAIVIDSNNNRNNRAKGYAEIPTSWASSSSTSGFYGTGYAYAGTKPISDSAVFWFYLDKAATKTVQAWWTAGSNRSKAAPFIIQSSHGTRLGKVLKDQTRGGGAWRTLGTYNFTKGWNKVMVSRWAAEGDVVIADAVRVK